MPKPGSQFERAMASWQANAERIVRREGRVGSMSLEDQVKRLARRQELTSIFAAVVGALALAMVVYVAVRVDRLSDNVGKIPAEIATDVRDALKTASQEAAQSRQPQVVVLPTTQVPQNPASQQPAVPPPVVLGPHSSNR
jgi:hypothetical protein